MSEILTAAGERFRRHLGETVTLAGVLTALRGVGLTAEVALWVPGVLVVLASFAICAAFAAWPTDATANQLHARLGVQTIAITSVVYATGWGPGLAMVLAFGIADSIKVSGSSAARSALAWAALGIVFAQLAIARGIAPTLIPEPAVHGLAVLAVLGLAMVVHRFSRTTRDKEQAEEAMRTREARFRALVQHSSDVIVVVDDQARMTYLSPPVERVFGWTPRELDGMRFLELIHPDDLSAIKAFVAEVAERPGDMAMVECRLRAKDGTWRHVESVGNNLLHDPELRGFVLNTRDVTDRRSLEEQLEHRAFHDSLTGLANRALFTDRVEHTVARGTRRLEPFAVLFLDLDGFKTINDSLGHAAGDELLVEVGERIRLCLRDADTAARLGGDEFAVLLEDLVDEHSPARIAERILEELRRPVHLAGKEVTVDASIGIALNGNGETADELLRNADIAMYMAKGSGKGRFELFEPAMHHAVVERLELEADLARAIGAEEFVLHYQPIVELESQRITGVEALVRWNHPERGFISPADFIPLAEQTGLIVPLGRWVLHEACRQMAEWQRDDATEPPLHIAVNLSAAQLLAGGIVDEVEAALEESGIAPETLTLEITESALVTDTELTIATLQALKRLGVRLAIDDFGTGYSSLSYLQRFPIDVLKIDRSFIDQAGDEHTNPALVRAIVELGHTLRLQTVAEGIERPDQLTQFRALQCHLGQGYLFARPADGATISELLVTQRGRRAAMAVIPDPGATPIG